MLHISDAQNCALHFKNEFIDKYYKITTQTNNSFILKAEEKQFPHLIGINKAAYQRYRLSATDVFYQFLLSSPKLPQNIISNNIQEASKKRKKDKEFYYVYRFVV